MIVGVDVSSKQINLAWIDGGPQRWHQVLGKGALIDRLRAIHIEWPQDVAEVCIEYPFTPQRGAIAALMATVGVITHQAPSYCRVSWVKTADLRDAIGARNRKDAAHAAVYDMFPGSNIGYDKLGYVSSISNGGQLAAWSPDDLDALVACIGWTRILAQQEDAA